MVIVRRPLRPWARIPHQNAISRLENGPTTFKTPKTSEPTASTPRFIYAIHNPFRQKLPPPAPVHGLQTRLMQNTEPPHKLHFKIMHPANTRRVKIVAAPKTPPFHPEMRPVPHPHHGRPNPTSRGVDPNAAPTPNAPAPGPTPNSARAMTLPKPRRKLANAAGSPPNVPPTRRPKLHAKLKPSAESVNPRVKIFCQILHRDGK